MLISSFYTVTITYPNQSGILYCGETLQHIASLPKVTVVLRFKLLN